MDDILIKIQRAYQNKDTYLYLVTNEFNKILELWAKQDTHSYTCPHRCLECERQILKDDIEIVNKFQSIENGHYATYKDRLKIMMLIK